MSHFLMNMKCNLREQIPKLISYSKKSFFKKKFATKVVVIIRETYKLFFEFFWLVMSYFLMHPFYFGRNV